MTQTPVSHGRFSIERIYPASPALVFAAWSDIEIKARWFIGPEGWTQLRREQTFEAGGTQILHGRFASGFETLYEARFHDIVAEQRIVYVYDLHLNGAYHSVSLATVDIEPVEGGTA